MAAAAAAAGVDGGLRGQRQVLSLQLAGNNPVGVDALAVEGAQRIEHKGPRTVGGAPFHDVIIVHCILINSLLLLSLRRPCYVKACYPNSPEQSCASVNTLSEYFQVKVY